MSVAREILFLKEIMSVYTLLDKDNVYILFLSVYTYFIMFALA